MQENIPRLVQRILTGDGLSEDDYIELASDNNFDLALAVAQSKHSPISALFLSSIYCNERIQEAVCSNPVTPIRILEDLSQSDNPVISTKARDGLKRRNVI